MIFYGNGLVGAIITKAKIGLKDVIFRNFVIKLGFLGIILKSTLNQSFRKRILFSLLICLFTFKSLRDSKFEKGPTGGFSSFSSESFAFPEGLFKQKKHCFKFIFVFLSYYIYNRKFSKQIVKKNR